MPTTSAAPSSPMIVKPRANGPTRLRTILPPFRTGAVPTFLTAPMRGGRQMALMRAGAWMAGDRAGNGYSAQES
jgi:hypothetical protein